MTEIRSYGMYAAASCVKCGRCVSRLTDCHRVPLINQVHKVNLRMYAEFIAC